VGRSANGELCGESHAGDWRIATSAIGDVGDRSARHTVRCRTRDVRAGAM